MWHLNIINHDTFKFHSRLTKVAPLSISSRMAMMADRERRQNSGCRELPVFSLVLLFWWTATFDVAHRGLRLLSRLTLAISLVAVCRRRTQQQRPQHARGSVIGACASSEGLRIGAPCGLCCRAVERASTVVQQPACPLCRHPPLRSATLWLGGSTYCGDHHHACGSRRHGTVAGRAGRPLPPAEGGGAEQWHFGRAGHLWDAMYATGSMVETFEAGGGERRRGASGGCAVDACPGGGVAIDSAGCLALCSGSLLTGASLFSVVSNLGWLLFSGRLGFIFVLWWPFLAAHPLRVL